MKSKSKTRPPTGQKKSTGSASSTICKVIVASLLAWLIIQLQYFLYTNKPHARADLALLHDTSSSMIANAEREEDLGPSVAILLQVSPVRADRQISRLQAIDHGYATWTRQDDQGGSRPRRVTIFAAVHNSSSHQSSSGIKGSHPPIIFQNIKQVRTYGDNPFYKLLDAFVGLMSEDICSEWLVMANDHSFFIPVNLQRYLRTLQSSTLVYGGNRLGLKYHNKLLFFASGGAGAILSRAAVNALLVLWSVLHREYCLELLGVVRQTVSSSATSLNPPHATCNQTEKPADEGGGDRGKHFDIELTGGGGDWLEAMQCLMKAFEKTYSPDHNPSQVTAKISLSSRVIMQMSRLGGPNGEVNVQLVSSSQQHQPAKVVHFQLFNEQNKFCSSNSKWALDNPGIIVAGCLQEVFEVPFTDSSWSPVAHPVGTILENATPKLNSSPRNTHIRREELFNVYGPVRLCTADIDDWYVNMKNRVLEADHAAASPDNNASLSSYSAPSTRFLYTPFTREALGSIAKHVVSFHYISESESTLLFRILSGQARRRAAAEEPAGSKEQLLQAWPRGAAVGDYARPLKSLQEAANLLSYLNSIDMSR